MNLPDKGRHQGPREPEPSLFAKNTKANTSIPTPFTLHQQGLFSWHLPLLSTAHAVALARSSNRKVDLASQQLSTGTSASPPHLAVTLRALATLHPPSLARWRGPLNAPPVGRRHGWFAAVVLLRSLLLAEVVMDGLLGKVPELQVVALFLLPKKVADSCLEKLG